MFIRRMAALLQAFSLTLTAPSASSAVTLKTGAKISWVGGGGTTYITDTEIKLRPTAGSQLVLGIAGQAVWIMNGATNNFWCDPGSLATIQGAALRADTSVAIDYIKLGSGRNTSGTNTADVYTQTSGYKRNIWHIPQFAPPSGSGSWTAHEINPTINGVSSGNATMLAVAPVVTALTGGTVSLLDMGTTTTDFSTGYTSKFKVDTNGKLTLPTAAGAPTCGTATLVGGTVTVATTAVTAASKILLTRNTSGGTVGDLKAATASIVAGTSFVIASASGTDTSTVNWFLFN